MRWSRLFADLESQVEALVSGELTAEVAERTRAEVGGIDLADRLRAAQDHPIEVTCWGAGTVRGRLVGCGADWLLLAEAAGTEALVPAPALLGVGGLGRAVAPPAGVVERRLGLRHALRGVAKDRSPVLVGLVDGSTLTGTLDRVGADFVDLAEHPPGEPRRATAVVRVVALPMRAIAVIRRG